MAKEKLVKSPENSKKILQNTDSWKLHDIYSEDVCSNRVITRSQVGFAKIRNTESDTELFADSSKHHPAKMTHLISTLKGDYGAVPRTKITRNLANNIEISETLVKDLGKYKARVIVKEKDEKTKEEFLEASFYKDSDKEYEGSKEFSNIRDKLPEELEEKVAKEFSNTEEIESKESKASCRSNQKEKESKEKKVSKATDEKQKESEEKLIEETSDEKQADSEGNITSHGTDDKRTDSSDKVRSRMNGLFFKPNL